MPRDRIPTRREFLALLGAARLLAAANAPDYAAMRAQLRGRNLFIVPFSHVDWAWVNSRQWMVHRHAIVLSEVLDLLRTNPEFRFYIETWNEQMEPFVFRSPERVPELRSAIQQGKVEVCGGVCNQHPSWMGQESLIRDMAMGRRLFEKFAPGLNLDVLIHNDVTPGSSQMPQIATKAGYRFYRINRPEQGLNAEGVPADFRWKGLDGTELITSRGPTCGFISADPLPEDFDKRWQQTVEAVYKSEIGPELSAVAGTPVWLPLGCDDSRPMRSWHAVNTGGKWDEVLLPFPRFMREWNSRETSHMQFGTPIEVFREIAKRREALPVFAGVLDATMWTYWYGLNGNEGLRVWRARAEGSLLSAERFWTCAAIYWRNLSGGNFRHTLARLAPRLLPCADVALRR